MTQQTTTLVLGTGIIGLSTAHYLSQLQPPSTIHLVDPSPTLFASASGFAAGFLARDWFSPSVSELGALSFREHLELARREGGRERWGYERSWGWSYEAGSGEGVGDRKGERGEDWLRDGESRVRVAGVSEGDGAEEGKGGVEPKWLKRSKGDEMEMISQEGSTAQVDPHRLCKFLLQSCRDRGVQLHHPATAISVKKDIRDELSSIRILNTETNTETDIPCTTILIAAGAWSPTVFSTLFTTSKFKIPVQKLAGHSLVVRIPRWKVEDEERGCQAVFTTDEAGYSPELFTRVGGELYIAGFNSETIPLPDLATGSEIQDDAIKVLEQTTRRLLGFGKGEELDVVRRGLCFRPFTRKGSPILTKIPDEKLGGGISTRGDGEGGVFLAAGHGPWGITLSLGTGKVMA